MKTNINKNQIKLPGGTNGQALVKTSNADYDFDWESVIGSGGGSGNKLAIDTTAFSHTGDTNETTAYTIPIPGGTLGTNDAIRFTLIGNDDISGTTCTFRAKYGSSTFATIVDGGAGQAGGDIEIVGHLIANNATNSQIGSIRVARDTASDIQGGVSDGSTITEDSTTNLDLVITVQLSSGLQSVSLKAIIVEKISTVQDGITIVATAAEDITAGTPVGISNLLDDTVAKASYISRTVTTPSSTGIGKAINIGTDKIALLYNKASTSEMWLVIGTLNTSTNTFTFGTEVQVTGAITSVDNNWDITKLDTDVVAITYAETATAAECKLVIATISGTTITLGTPQTAVTAGSNVTGNSICTLATDKGVISYMVQGSQVFSIAFTVSGTVATFGSAVSADANLANGIIRSVKLDTDKFVIAVSNYAQVGTLSGTSITMGSALQVLSSYTTANTDLVQAGTNKFIYKAPPTGGGSKNAVACSVSGTTITAGSQINSGVASGLIYISDTEIYDAAVSSSTPTLKKLTLSGTTLTDIGTVIGLFLGASSLRSPLISIGSYWIGIDLNATTITYYVLGMSNNFIGFAQNSASKSGTVTVLTTGIDSNQTGLIPGSYYQVSQGALTRINTFEITDPIKSVR